MSAESVKSRRLPKWMSDFGKWMVDFDEDDPKPSAPVKVVKTLRALIRLVPVLLSFLQAVIWFVERTRLIQRSEILATSHPLSTAIVLTAVVIALGALASFWKRRALRSYALMEIAFGTSLGFNILLHVAPKFEFSKLFAVATAIYVIARGFNNFSDARMAINR